MKVAQDRQSDGVRARKKKSDRGCRKQKEREKVGGRWRQEGKKKKRKRRDGQMKLHLQVC